MGGTRSKRGKLLGLTENADKQYDKYRVLNLSDSFRWSFPGDGYVIPWKMDESADHLYAIGCYVCSIGVVKCAYKVTVTVGCRYLHSYSVLTYSMLQSPS